MKKTLRNSLAAVLFCVAASFASFAQNNTGTPPNAPELSISVSEARLKFAPTRTFQEMRLNVYNHQRELVYGAATVEAEMLWQLKNNNGEALAPGIYAYELTLKYGENDERQHKGHFILEQSLNQIWLTTNDNDEIGGSALLATRASGRTIARLPAGDDKSAKRDVNGRGIVDEKGNALTDSQGDKNAAKQGKAAVLATANQLAKYALDGVTLIDSAVTETGGNVGIGTNVPNAKLSVSANTAAPPSAPGVIGYFANVNGSNTFITADAYGGDNSLNLHSDFLFRRARGTMAAPSAVQADDIVGQIQMRGYGQTGFATTSRAGIRMTAAENWTDAAQGAYLAFLTTPNGTNGINVERMRLTDVGNLGIGIAAPGAKLAVAGDIRSSALRQELTASSPNIINGFIGTGSSGAVPGNRVTAGVAGATIGGGGFNGMLPLINLNTGNPITGDNSNQVTDWFGTVGGGLGNRAGNNDVTLENAAFATVGGGFGNTASWRYATVGGGWSNTASADFTTVGGGYVNTANSPYSTVGGGLGNTASANFATVGGGRENIASGHYSFAVGRRAKAINQGAFVWADATDDDFLSTGDNQFLIRAAGGVGIGTNGTGGFRLNVYNAGSEGLRVATDTAGGRVASFGGSGTFEIDAPFVGGGRLTVLENGNVGIGATNPAYKLVVSGDSCSNNYPCASDARLKTQVTGLRYGLSQLMRLRPVSWQWKDSATTQLPLGLIAQEVEPVMPELVLHSTTTDGTLGLNYMGLLPVMIKATQEQQKQIQQLLQANQQLRQRVNRLERRSKTQRR